MGASNCGAHCNVQHSSEWQIALSKYRDDGNDSLTTPLAPNAVSASPFSPSTDETKVLNKVHQCVLFTKAKRRCHNLTHTLHAHTHRHSLTHPHTHRHMQSGACITLSGARREFRIYATMLPTRPDDTSAQRECLYPCLCLCHCPCVCVPWCVCV